MQDSHCRETRTAYDVGAIADPVRTRLTSEPKGSLFAFAIASPCKPSQQSLSVQGLRRTLLMIHVAAQRSGMMAWAFFIDNRRFRTKSTEARTSG